MKFKFFNSDGSANGDKEVDNFPILDEEKVLMHLGSLSLRFMRIKDKGNASTKVRSEVRGSGKKIYRQKGLGVGRAGDKKATQRRGGGIVFGPRPRSYSQKLNKKLKCLQ